MKDLLHFLAGIGAIALVLIFYKNDSLIQSIVLLFCFSVFIITTIYTMRKDKKKQKDEDEDNGK